MICSLPCLVFKQMTYSSDSYNLSISTTISIILIYFLPIFLGNQLQNCSCVHFFYKHVFWLWYKLISEKKKKKGGTFSRHLYQNSDHINLWQDKSKKNENIPVVISLTSYYIFISACSADSEMMYHGIWNFPLITMFELKLFFYQ